MTEDQIEQFAIERLGALGYVYQHGPAIEHDGEQPERESYEQVLPVLVAEGRTCGRESEE
ncbi:MAG: hypothetical protein H6590_08960 [Flavobacteriales bacterium]|nr:hypothetical protein [Flavobacteriales bacterium]MCB9179534.1 hypothetical protein [Flavobacteriales bacterium]